MVVGWWAPAAHPFGPTLIWISTPSEKTKSSVDRSAAYDQWSPDARTRVGTSIHQVGCDSDACAAGDRIDDHVPSTPSRYVQSVPALDECA